jgi:hypothetical protein
MTQDEAIAAIINIPLGSRIKITLYDGTESYVRLSSYDVSGTGRKEYGTLVVPELPPALTVVTPTNFGETRIDLIEIEQIEPA